MTDIEATIQDDGTLDFVLEVRCGGCGKVWEERFNMLDANWTTEDIKDMIEAGELEVDEECGCK